jgi:acyl-CoA thioesterase
MTDHFFDLQPGIDSHHWRLPVTPWVSVGPPGNVFLFGGVGLGAALTALEAALKRPVAWATAQYLSHARPGAELDLHITVLAAGRNTSHAQVIVREGERTVFMVSAALGARADNLSHQWSGPPDAPSPSACVSPDWWPRMQEPNTLSDRLEMRVPDDRRGQSPTDGQLSPDGRLLFWLRTREDFRVDAGVLAIFADFVPSGVAAALGGGLGGTSLDNTLRIVRIVPTRWVLCDIRIHGVDHGFAHGEARLFAETGELLAIASQTVNAWIPNSTTKS